MSAVDYLSEFLFDVFKTPTDRDKQRLVGASNISQLCNRCLADDMLQVRREPSDFWAGAVIGTAVHDYAERRVNEHPYLTEKYPTVETEFRMTLGEIPGYGVVKSTSDLYFPEIKCVGDYKTTTKAKLKFIKKACERPQSEFEEAKVTEARYKIAGYANQAHLYGWGYQQAGYPVERVSLLFVCRDAGTDADFFIWDAPYDGERALKVWDRAVRLWEWLQSHDADGLDSHPLCWYCNNIRD